METAVDREADVRVRALLMCCGVLGATLGAGATGAAALAAPTAAATTTTVTVSPSTAHPYQAVTVTATVTTTAGVTPPAGTVDITRGSETWCSGLVVDPASGTASCSWTEALTVGVGAVTASFTPAAGAAFGSSSAKAPLTAVAWTPVVHATASTNTAGCTSAHSLRFVVAAPSAATAATAGRLPPPTGTITQEKYGIVATLTDGLAVVCLKVWSTSLTYTYSGDANYASARASLAIKSPDNAPHGGNGAPTDGPTPTPTSTPGPGTATAAPALAATGLGAGVLPAAAIGLVLLLVGGGVVLGARARRET